MDQTPAVLRFRDGRTERVILATIDPAHETIKAFSDDGSPEDVAFSELKAIFFPHDPHADEDETASTGSTVAVEFADGEVIRGIATYNPEKNGFFLFPHDRSKNDRVFVVNSAIVSIEVEKL
jgi:hypothetical protein